MNRLRKVILTCGYRRTGKDTFFTKVSSETDDLFYWRIYKHPTASHRHIDRKLTYQRIAFADSLKEEASIQYGIPVIISDAEKDIKQFIHYQTGELVSARDIHIEWGAIRRSEDPDYWCKAAFNKMELTSGDYLRSEIDHSSIHSGIKREEERSSSSRDLRSQDASDYLRSEMQSSCIQSYDAKFELVRTKQSELKESTKFLQGSGHSIADFEVTNTKDTCYVVTDWRFHNEAAYTHYSYDDVLTVRLYHSEVPEPNANIESEHNLDNYQTDFLLLRDDLDGEYEKAMEKFPQYSGYVPCEKI